MAVKLRKMTDEQLVRYVEDQVYAARKLAFAEGFSKGESSKIDAKSAAEFIDWIQREKIPGIGVVTIKKLIKVAAEYGYTE